MIYLHKTAFLLSAILFVWQFSACTRHELDVKPVEIKPIHITIDVKVKVDRALDDFFEDIDQAIQKDASQ